MKELVPISIVIPTYKREQVLVNTIEYLQKLDYRPAEIIVVDQTLKHERKTEQQLNLLNKKSIIRWIRLQRPSIPHAMNTGLLKAKHEVVLFLDDDIIPDKNLIFAHFHAHCDKSVYLVAGRAIKP
jgi:glycosyltransferase involved in cell wall biosynthesis